MVLREGVGYSQRSGKQMAYAPVHTPLTDRSEPMLMPLNRRSSSPQEAVVITLCPDH